ncbi:MAG: NifU family protein [Flavobacteriales bacterium]|nr:NifU family protein [Flavobacteriales bacterium]
MMTKEIEEKVLIALDEIRPFLEKDGGDISLDSISDNKIVNVRLHGTCVGCKVNQMTLKLGVETIIKRHVPHIEKVNSVL